MEAIKENVRLMIDSGIDHEFRTTIVREQLEVGDLKIGELVKERRNSLCFFVPARQLVKVCELPHFTDRNLKLENNGRHVGECVIH